MNGIVAHEPEIICSECGRFGAYAFDGVELCVDCYQQRGSCCAERALCWDDANVVGQISEYHESGESVVAPVAAPLDPARLNTVPGEVFKLNPNCCYKACPRCSSVRRLREFQAKFPQDWRARLRGPERLLEVARQRNG